MVTLSDPKELVTPMAAHTVTESGMLRQKSTHNYNWIIDTGAIDHMTNNKDHMTTYSPKQINIQTANGSVAPVTGEGSVKISNSMDLDSVLVVHSLSSNLLSVCQIIEALNYYVTF